MQSALIAGRIRTLAGEKNLPVIAFIEDVGASGGYWLALAGDEIFAAPSSIVGSIGVVHASFGFADVLDGSGSSAGCTRLAPRNRCSTPSGRRTPRTSTACWRS